MANNKKFYLQHNFTNVCYVGSIENFDVKVGDKVVAELESFGQEILQVIRECENKCNNKTVKVLRIATKEDLDLCKDVPEKEKEYFNKVKSSIEEEKLKMNLIKVHFVPLSKLLVIFYTSSDRVDFRNFVKNAYKNIGLRVFMWQLMNPRDYGKFIHTCGMCGRPTCCSISSSICENCNPNTKTLKEQNIILNSSKNIGVCGLMCCCMAYEVDYYREAKSSYPKIGDEVLIDDKKYLVSDINYVSSNIKLENKDELSIIVVKRNSISKNEQNEWVSIGKIKQ